jgi:hypothetical protein
MTTQKRFVMELREESSGDLVHRWILEPNGRGGVETLEGGAIHNAVPGHIKDWQDMEELRTAGADAPVPDCLFKELSQKEDATMRQWLRSFFKPGDAILPHWHPVARAEAASINAAAKGGR